MTEYLYELEHGSYYLVRQAVASVPRLMTDRVAMAYHRSGDDAVLMKHGDSRSVAQWLAAARAQYTAAGEVDMANALEMIVFPGGFSVDEINKCLTTSGYIGTLLSQINAQIEAGDS